MSIVCVLIGEGKSEKAFFQSLLLKKLSFVESQDKNCIVYQSQTNTDLFWIFPIPSFGASHQGGYTMLQKKDTYIDCKYIVQNHRHIFGENPIVHYRIIVDTDNHPPERTLERLNKIREAMSLANLGGFSEKVYPINIEIETWFIAGFRTDFPFIGDTAKARKLIAETNSETVLNPKEKLDAILEKSISGDRYRIARDVGEHFDTEQALEKSKSFKDFFKSLNSDGLIT